MVDRWVALVNRILLQQCLSTLPQSENHQKVKRMAMLKGYHENLPIQKNRRKKKSKLIQGGFFHPYRFHTFTHIVFRLRNTSTVVASTPVVRYDKLQPDEVKEVLLCLLYVLKHADEEALISWWHLASQHDLICFFHILEYVCNECIFI